MNKYIMIRRGSQLKFSRFTLSDVAAVVPISYTVSASIESGNDMELKLRMSECTQVSIGDIVDVGEPLFLSKILSKEVDRKTRIVTFRGMSILGMLSGIPVGPNAGIQDFTFYNMSSVQWQSLYEGHVENNFRKFCNLEPVYRYGLPLCFTESLSEYQTEAWFTANGYDDVSGCRYVKLYFDKDSFFSLICKFLSTCDKAISIPSINEYTHEIQAYFYNAREIRHILTDEDAVFIDEIPVTLGINRDLNRVAYIDTVGQQKIVGMQSFTYSDMMWSGLNIRSMEDSSDTEKEFASNFSAACKKANVKGQINLTDSDVDVRLGDYIYCVDTELGIETEKVRVVEKLLEMQGDSQKITINVGG